MMQRFPDRGRVLLQCILALTLWVISATAQVDTGAIVGRVHDPSGAVVPDATITITNLDTNTKETTRTSSNGQFAVPLLKVGTYSVTVEKAGFQRFVQSGINVDVQARLDVDVTLQLGPIPQEVHVTLCVNVVETPSAS